MSDLEVQNGALAWNDAQMLAGGSADDFLRNEWENADVIHGADLVSKKTSPKLFDQLCGTPFLITRAVFRPGDVKPKHLDYQPDYVSLEAVIPPSDVLVHRLKFAGIDDTPFEPGQMIVFNDGSTGARRQVVHYLVAKGLLVREGKLDGGMGESVLDTPVATEGEVAFDIRLTCPRGLRKSEYDNEYTQEGKTYYLA